MYTVIKKSLGFFVSAFCLFSCVNEQDLTGKNNGNESLHVIATDLESIIPVEELEVPVRKGYTTVVLWGKDTLATTNYATSIVVPRQARLSPKAYRREGMNAYKDITFEYIKDNGTSLRAHSTLWQVVAFEDSYKADYDYNDLIIHSKIEVTRDECLIHIKPVAMGASKKIALGAVVTDENGNVINDLLFCNDTRSELFRGFQGFINTTDDGTEKIYFSTDDIRTYTFPKISESLNLKINWYIVAEGTTCLYAVPSDRKMARNIDLSAEGLPYGLAMTNIYGDSPFTDLSGEACGYDWFYYPLENVKITDVYPGFLGWLEGTGSVDFSKPAQGEYFDAVGTPGPDGRYTDCLYLWSRTEEGGNENPEEPGDPDGLLNDSDNNSPGIK